MDPDKPLDPTDPLVKQEEPGKRTDPQAKPGKPFEQGKWEQKRKEQQIG